MAKGNVRRPPAKPKPKQPDKAGDKADQYTDPMRNIAAGGTGHNPEPPPPQPKKPA